MVFAREHWEGAVVASAMEVFDLASSVTTQKKIEHSFFKPILVFSIG